MDSPLPSSPISRCQRSRGAVAASVAIALVAAWLAAARAEPSAPLPAVVGVTASHTYLRAGPSDDFYPTERLTHGATVEVWSVDAAGYCAVRPVAGSFSWMRARDVATETTGAEATGVVVTDGAVARVGSQLNDLRHVTQVALEAGERVRVFEQVRVEQGRHAGEWVRIAPPSGEFRWARGEDLDLPPQLAVVAPAGSPPAAAGLAAAGEALAAIQEARAAVTQAVAEIDTVTTAADPAAPGLFGGSPAGRLLSGWLPLGTGRFAAEGAPPTAVSGGAVAASADELTDIDLALSLAVTGPSESWNLEPLRARLQQAAARSTAQSERTRAQAIDARLARFEAIQGRQRMLAATGAPVDSTPLRLGGMWSSLSALGSRPIRPGVLPGGVPAGGQPTWTPPDQMETTGRLATVVSRRPDAPRWALVDDSNNVLVFVTPQTGVNLAPLVGQQVSVRGSRGYMPEYQRPYLVAAEARTRIAAAPPVAGLGDRTQ
jgi:hypothetical protein